MKQTVKGDTVLQIQGLAAASECLKKNNVAPIASVFAELTSTYGN